MNQPTEKTKYFLCDACVGTGMNPKMSTTQGADSPYCPYCDGLGWVSEKNYKTPYGEPSEQHPEDTCQKCGGPNVLWYAESELFNKVNGSPNGIICPKCFIKMASEQGESIIFKAVRIKGEPSEQPKEEDQLEKSLRLLRLALDTMPKEKLDKILEEIEAMDLGGPTVEEYMSSLGKFKQKDETDSKYYAAMEPPYIFQAHTSEKEEHNELMQLLSKINEETRTRPDLNGNDLGLLQNYLCTLKKPTESQEEFYVEVTMVGGVVYCGNLHRK